jgi:HD-GYP domain-containing protein (c-di-GMP phosphodiesterase class II)
MSSNASGRVVKALSRMPSSDLSLLLQVSRALAASLEIDEVLQTAIESAVRTLGLDTGAIYLLEGSDLTLGATTPPLPPGFPEALRRAQLGGHPHVARCLAEREPVSLVEWAAADLTPPERAVCEARGLRSVLFVPVLVAGEAVGAFIVGSVGRVHAFSERDVELCRALSHEIGLALANARLYESLQRSHEELERAYEETIEGWSLALEMRDDETQGHALRVADLAVELGRGMGMSEEALVHLRRGALLHDIGKMVVPDAILHKPGPLTDEEWAVMRRHPESGRDFLRKVAYLAPALDVPYAHHERWDGSGYPRGLAGEEIPLAARVFAVADSFDALTSDRPYRPAWTEEATLAYIRERAGTHYDPAVVAVLPGRRNAGPGEERG